MKPHDPLENVLGRIDDLDEASLSNLVSRLARERRLLNTLFNTLREGVIVIDARGTIDYANATSSSMLGFERRDVGSANLWKQVPDLARSLQFTKEGLLAADAGISRELQLTYPELRVVRLYLMPFEEETEGGARLARFAVILSDITSEKTRSQHELEDERVRSILQLSAGVAHELGNPLNSLNIHLQVMERTLGRMTDSATAAKLRKSLEICSGEVARLDSIITHFLDAVRPTPPDLRELDPIMVLEEALEFLGPELESAGITVDVSLDRTVPIVEADHNQLKQVFFNLLKNARQAMKAGGEIKVHASSDDEFVYLRIGDTGEGIAEEDLPQVFQPYFTTKSGGHGLGMMIVERIMRDHGGQIGIDSRRGVGTVVTLQFPQKVRRVRMLEQRRDREDGGWIGKER